jgi:hypothetical protein
MVKPATVAVGYFVDRGPLREGPDLNTKHQRHKTDLDSILRRLK